MERRYFRLLIVTVVGLVPMGVGRAYAQWFIFRGGAGVVWPRDIRSTAGAFAELYYYPGVHWAVGSDVGFWSQVERRCERVPSPPRGERLFCEDVQFRDVTVSMSLLVGTAIRRLLGIFVGGGFSSHFLDARSDSLRFGFGGTSLGGSDIRVGFQVFAGVDVRISKRWGLFVVGRYDGVDGAAQWKAYGGLHFRFQGGTGRRRPMPPPEPE